MNKFVLIAIFLVSTQTLAGVSTAGDGGHAVLCKGSRVVQFLDMYEAHRYFGLHPRPKSIAQPKMGSVYVPEYFLDYIETEIGVSFRKARKLLGANHPFLKTFDKIIPIATLASHKPAVADTNDFGSIQGNLSEGCRVVQFARYKFENGLAKVEINDRLRKRFRYIDTLALFMHEAFHEWFAPYNTDTIAVRQTVIYLLADSRFQKKNVHLFVELINERRVIDPNRFWKRSVH